jgi:hypothetical protein
MFRRVQAAMKSWTRRIDSDTALARLKALLDREGKLTSWLIDAEPGMPGCGYYRQRFNGIGRAYALVGYRPPRDLGWLEGYGHRERLLAAYRGRVADRFRSHGLTVEPESLVVMAVGGRIRLGVLFARYRPWKGLPRWLAQLHVEPQPDWLLVARLQITAPVILDHCLIRGGLVATSLGASHKGCGYEEQYEADLEPLIARIAGLATIPTT